MTAMLRQCGPSAAEPGLLALSEEALAGAAAAAGPEPEWIKWITAVQGETGGAGLKDRGFSQVGASLPTRQIWTALLHDGPDHLGLW